MALSPMAPEENGDPQAQASPWPQTAAFAALSILLIWKQPQLALSLAAFGVVIFVHELGHFVMARWQGMRVEAFSLGFGPPLVSVKRGETTYQIAAIPLGGFVKPAGEDPQSDEDILKAKPDEFMGRPWWSRALVLLAGPAMNLVFPLLALFAVYATVGRSYPWGPPRVQEVMKDSAALKAGILPEDLIVKINGQQVSQPGLLADLVDSQSRLNLDKPLDVELLRKDKPLKVKVRTKLNPELGKYLMGISVLPSAPPFSTTVRTAGVLTPAEKAGFKAGDVVLQVGGLPLKDGFSFSKQFASAATDPVVIQVRRGDKVLELTAAKKQPVPEGFDPELLGLVGLDFEPAGAQGQAVQREKLGVLKAGKMAWRDTKAAVTLTVVGLAQLIKGKLNLRESLGGPVAILRMAKQQAERGWEDLLNLMLTISITVGLLNLLPIPLLDGGTFVFCVIEGLRRKPVPLKVQAVAQKVGFALLGSLFVFTFANDILRWVGI